MGPLRPLSSEEWQALFVSEADGIVVGRVVGLRDTAATGDWELREKLVIRPSRWLKGNGPLEDFPVTLGNGPQLRSSDDDASPVLDSLARSRASFAGIFYLFRRRGAWEIYPQPRGLLDGSFVRLDDPAAETRKTRAVERMVARQSLDSLLARADLVIVGRNLGWPGAGLHLPGCNDIWVDSVLVGADPGGPIPACSPLLMPIDGDPTVFFLRRLPAGRFEYLDFRAGYAPLKGDMLARFGVPLSEIVRRARALRPRR